MSTTTHCSCLDTFSRTSRGKESCNITLWSTPPLDACLVGEGDFVDGLAFSPSSSAAHEAAITENERQNGCKFCIKASFYPGHAPAACGRPVIGCALHWPLPPLARFALPGRGRPRARHLQRLHGWKKGMAVGNFPSPATDGRVWVAGAGIATPAPGLLKVPGRLEFAVCVRPSLLKVRRRSISSAKVHLGQNCYGDMQLVRLARLSFPRRRGPERVHPITSGMSRRRRTYQLTDPRNHHTPSSKSRRLSKQIPDAPMPGNKPLLPLEASVFQSPEIPHRERRNKFCRSTTKVLN